MSWASENLSTVLLVLGFALLVVEVAVFGFSVFILLFIGLGCLVTGALMGLGLLPTSVTLALVLVAGGIFPATARKAITFLQKVRILALGFSRERESKQN